MGEFLSVFLYAFVGVLAVYLAACIILAVVAPRKFEAFKAWNIRRRAERKAERAEKRRLASLPSTALGQSRSQTPAGKTRVVHHHHHHDHGDPLLDGLIVGAAASSLRGDVEEAIAREITSSRDSDEREDRSGDW